MNFDEGTSLLQNEQIYKAKKSVVKFIRQSIACTDKETTNLEVVKLTPLLETLA
jgi:hypothetical protein